jgi:hypothetical protein
MVAVAERLPDAKFVVANMLVVTYFVLVRLKK